MHAFHHRCLEAMGIQVWQLRRPLQEASDTGVAPESLPSDLAASSSARSSEDPVEIPEGDASWTEVTRVNDSDREDHRSKPPALENRAVRIARMEWRELETEVSACSACQLHTGRTQAVFGVGHRQAQWMIIGEAPGADEDRLGEPFVGRAGKLLDAMLMALKLRRQEVFIANVLKCRPPKNRDPSREEAFCCRPFLERQIALVKPKIILAVGRIAAQNLLQTEAPLSKLRGRVYRLPPADIPLVVSYHPAYLLRSPREKRKSWEDLRLASRTLSLELQH